MALSGVRNREPLATLRATALQDLPAVLGGHTDQKAVGFLAVPTVRLKCTFALGHDCETSGAELAERRNLDSSEPTIRVSIAGGGNAMLSSVPRELTNAEFGWAGRGSPRSFPQLWKKMWKSAGAKVRNAL